MEVNRDEAEHCIEIALEAVNKGNIDRAERFLTKANNLYPTLKSKGFFLYINYKCICMYVYNPQIKIFENIFRTSNKIEDLQK